MTLLLRTLVLTAALLSGCTARLATHLVTHDVDEALLQREPPVATAMPTDIEVPPGTQAVVAIGDDA